MFATRPLKAAAPVFAAGLLLSAGATAAAKDVLVRRGEALPIYLHPEALAEAEKPGLDPAVSGGGSGLPARSGSAGGRSATCATTSRR